MDLSGNPEVNCGNIHHREAVLGQFKQAKMMPDEDELHQCWCNKTSLVNMSGIRIS